MPLATVCDVVPVIVVALPYVPHVLPVSVADLIVSVDVPIPELASVKSVRLLIVSVVPLVMLLELPAPVVAATLLAVNAPPVGTAVSAT